MVNMRAAYKWGMEARELVEERKKTEQARQRITYGKKTVSVEKGKIFNFADFLK